MKGTDNSGECTGLDHSGISLSDIGISKKQLKDSLSCVWGDFDGNGFMDVVIWGKLSERKGHIGTRKFKVLFFEEDRLIKSQIIENEDKDILEIYPKTDKSGEFGEPKTKLDGLVQWGEGGSTYIYLYDQRLGKLKRYDFLSENY